MIHWEDIELYQEPEEIWKSKTCDKSKSVTPALSLRRTWTPPPWPSLTLKCQGLCLFLRMSNSWQKPSVKSDPRHCDQNTCKNNLEEKIFILTVDSEGSICGRRMDSKGLFCGWLADSKGPFCGWLAVLLGVWDRLNIVVMWTSLQCDSQETVQERKGLGTRSLQRPTLMTCFLLLPSYLLNFPEPVPR